MQWARQRQPRMVSICNVHSVVTARDDRALQVAINNSDIATPDGMPVAWLLGWRRKIAQARVSGAELTMALCQRAAEQGIGVAFYGSSERTIAQLSAALMREFPQLRLSAAISPPFRPLSVAESAAHIRQLNDSGAGIVFVGLGCPKQEIWMAAHKAEINAVLIGIGAAFEFIAGTVKRPPLWMQRAGLEWLGRLIAEPKRLWRRYLVTNIAYICYIVLEIVLRRRPQSRISDL